MATFFSLVFVFQSEFPVPATLQSRLGCRMDRLTHMQKMVSVVQCLISDWWSFQEFIVLHVSRLVINRF